MESSNHGLDSLQVAGKSIRQRLNGCEARVCITFESSSSLIFPPVEQLKVNGIRVLLESFVVLIGVLDSEPCPRLVICKNSGRLAIPIPWVPSADSPRP